MAHPSLPIPPPELGKFIPPDLSRTYFNGAIDFPFDHAASDYSPRNAWWLAESSFSAYSGPADRIDLDDLRRANWDIDRISADSTQCLCFSNATTMVFAFRGTRIEGFNDPYSGFRLPAPNWSDVVTDLEFTQQDIGRGYLVHKGFHEALNEIFGEVDAMASRAVQAQKKIWCTGHSLGAALATLAAYRLSGHGVQGLYTFGSPRVGNGAFVNAYPVSNAYRFVHHRDIVTTVPPEGLYSHIGHLRYITADGRILDAMEKETLFSYIHEGIGFIRELVDITTKDFDASKVSTWPVPLEALADHAPIYYTNKIWNELVRADS